MLPPTTIFPEVTTRKYFSQFPSGNGIIALPLERLCRNSSCPRKLASRLLGCYMNILSFQVPRSFQISWTPAFAGVTAFFLHYDTVSEGGGVGWGW